DRIGFVPTEAHPRDSDTSLYHGYVKGRKSWTSTDVMVDADITDGTAPVVTMFTKLFTTRTTINAVVRNNAWNIDIQRYDDGTIAVLFKARAGDSPNCAVGSTTQACN